MRHKDENVKLLIFKRWQLKSGEVIKTRNKTNKEQWTNEKTETRWKTTLAFDRRWSIELFAQSKENWQARRKTHASDNPEKGLEMTQWNFE